MWLIFVINRFDLSFGHAGMSTVETTNGQLAVAPRVIQPTRGWAALRLDEVWEFRDLLLFFTWRDIKVRYKQTVFGAAWAIMQPLLTMVVFSLFFGRLAKIPSDGTPYPIFSFTALVPWSFFIYGLTHSANSLVGNANLIKKVYFPRILVPSSNILSGFVDFVLAFAVLILMAAGYGMFPTARLLVVPGLVLLAGTTALGAGLWLCALNVQFRDIRYTMPFLTQLWMFGTPIAYPASLIPNEWRIAYALNPMVSAVEGFRWAMLGTTSISLLEVVVSSMMAVALLLSGAFYFRRSEKSFADVV